MYSEVPEENSGIVIGNCYDTESVTETRPSRFGGIRVKRRSKSPPVRMVTSGARQTPPKARPNRGEISVVELITESELAGLVVNIT